MSLRTLAVAALAASALVPAAAQADEPVSTNADQVLCHASVSTQGGGVQHGSYELTLPDTHVSLAAVAEAAGSDVCDAE